MTSTRADRRDVAIYISASEAETFAESCLHTRDAAHLVGRGRAYHNRGEQVVPEGGEELGVARSLTKLSQRLFQPAYADIEGIRTTTHETSSSRR